MTLVSSVMTEKTASCPTTRKKFNQPIQAAISALVAKEHSMAYGT